MKNRIDVRSSYESLNINFSIHPLLVDDAFKIIAPIVVKFIADAKLADDYLVGWGPIRFVKAGNEIFIQEFSIFDGEWNHDITMTITNIIGQDNFLKILKLSAEPCFYSQNIVIHREVLCGGTSVYCRIKTENENSSGWLVYPLAVWQAGNDNVHIQEKDLVTITTFELVKQINPLLIQALILPSEIQFAYKKGRREISIVDDNLLVSFLNFDDETRDF